MNPRLRISAVIQVHGGIHQDTEDTGVKFNRSYDYVSEQRNFFRMGTREEYFFRLSVFQVFMYYVYHI